jgi:phosphoenolpyruvate synthase/pyruvate phosphate dikinase
MNKELSNLQKKSWYLEHFNGYPAFTEMSGTGFTKKLYDSNLPVYKIDLCYYRDGEGDFMSLVTEHQRVGGSIIKKYIQNKNQFEKLYNQWLKNFDLMMNFYYETFNEYLGKLDIEELKKWMNNFYNFYSKEVSLPGFINGYMFYADSRFNDILKAFCQKNHIKNHIEIYSILSAPLEQSFINEEEEDLKKIAKNYLRKKDVKKTLYKHLTKYSWIKSSYTGFKKYSKKDAIKEMKELIRTSNLKSIKYIFQKNKNKKEKLFEKYIFTKEIKAITHITELFIIWQDKRKVLNMTFAALQEKVLIELSKRFDINSKSLKYCQIKDLFDIANGKIDKRKINKQKESLFKYENGKITKIYTGKEASYFLKKVSKTNIAKVEELNGMSASLGMAKGRVKIIKSIKDFKKIQLGDILVSPMTRPEHLAIMKKASAIITDDGRITCHAAIISRELKIPCIIGTKTATKVLKDGNIVEINANTGLIKIIR